MIIEVVADLMAGAEGQDGFELMQTVPTTETSVYTYVFIAEFVMQFLTESRLPAFPCYVRL